MKEVKAYKKQESDCEMVVSEPAGMYGPTYLQGLKNRLIVSIKESDDEAMLEQCLELLHHGSMPCVYTDEEFAEEIKLTDFGRRGILNLRQNLSGRIMDIEKANLL